MATYPALATLAKELPELVVYAYADDIVLAGTPELLARAVPRARQLLGACGLELNPGKSEVWPPLSPEQAVAFPDLAALAFEKLTTMNGRRVIVLLGVPLVGDIGGFLWDCVNEAVAAAVPLPELLDCQAEIIVLRAAGPASRVTHLLRAVPRSILAPGGARGSRPGARCALCRI
jgi:hypothetical protein